MKVDQYRKVLAKELRRGSTLFVHRTRLDNEGDPLHKPFLLDKKNKVKANAYKIELAGYDWTPVPTVATAPVGMEATKAPEKVEKEAPKVRKTKKVKQDDNDKA